MHFSKYINGTSNFVSYYFLLVKDIVRKPVFFE